MTAAARAAGGGRARADPALAFTVALLWIAIGLFVLYPIAMLLARVFVDHGHFTLGGVAALVTDRNQVAAFRNSLVLGALVGLAGTLAGFGFALAATR